MKITFAVNLCFAFLLGEVAIATAQNEITKNSFPYMAIIYYPDDTIKEDPGIRFQRTGVLVRPDWLISAAIDSKPDDKMIAFPKKTLIARVGAITIDTKYSLNEDDYEQEREVIVIVRPSNHNASEWWFSDITLLKTLLPFNITPSVAPTSLTHKIDFSEKTCSILVYAKSDSSSEEKTLMQRYVELVSSPSNCGPYFWETSMFCGDNSEENKNHMYTADFCQGNRGGPLLCEGEVRAIQTYVDNECKVPFLFQNLTFWHPLIQCAIEDKYQNEECTGICDVEEKDSNTLVTADVPKPSLTTRTFVTVTTKASESFIEKTTPKVKITKLNYTISDDKVPQINVSQHSDIVTQRSNITSMSINITAEVTYDKKLEVMSTEKVENVRRRLDGPEDDNRRVPIEAQIQKKIEKSSRGAASLTRVPLQLVILLCIFSLSI